MDKNLLIITCYDAIVNGCLPNMSQRWDLATAEMLRSNMLKQGILPQDVGAIDIYNALLPAFDIGTSDDDKSPCSFEVPSNEDFQREGIDTSSIYKERDKTMARTYVKMEVLYDETGKMIPTVLHWIDGRKYPIDRVTDVRQAANLKNGASGGAGVRYTCRIMDQERYLWFMEGKWFVEKKDPVKSDGLCNIKKP